MPTTFTHTISAEITGTDDGDGSQPIDININISLDGNAGTYNRYFLAPGTTTNLPLPDGTTTAYNVIYIKNLAKVSDGTMIGINLVSNPLVALSPIILNPQGFLLLMQGTTSAMAYTNTGAPANFPAVTLPQVASINVGSSNPNGSYIEYYVGL